ncbi:MAG: LuxR C-terminal-related transcriptional regulator [Oribacterium sp.]|nr:LuxR C-terminal-related transcriptional regulator [Oribacterium sp.]
MVETEFQAVSAFSWPRLFAILGYVLVGAIGDYREGRYVNITLFSAILWLIICPALLSDNDSIMLIMVIFYIVVGVYMGYMYFMFFTLSPYLGKQGILYASGGRIIEGTAGVLFSLLPWDGMKTWHIIAIGIMSVTIMAAAIVRDYVTAKESGKTMDAGERANADDIGTSPEDADTAEKNISEVTDSAVSNVTEIVDEAQSIPVIVDVTVRDTSETVDAAAESPSEVGEDIDPDLSQHNTENYDTRLVYESKKTGEETISEDEEFETSDVPDSDAESRKQILAVISKKYDFTSREQEVFEKLIFTEDSGQEIADALFISRRVLQRHVAAIYEKTGTKSRVGLFRIYHKASLER